VRQFDLDIGAAAVEAGVGESTIRRWIASGRLVPVQRNPVLVNTETVHLLRDLGVAARRAPLDSANRLRETAH
jgi:hypothetical protein